MWLRPRTLGLSGYEILDRANSQTDCSIKSALVFSFYEIEPILPLQASTVTGKVAYARLVFNRKLKYRFGYSGLSSARRQYYVALKLDARKPEP